jgi:hypothetical protein
MPARAPREFVLLALLALLAVGACGGGAAPLGEIPDPTLPPSWNALATEPSAAGTWTVVVWTSPQPPMKGVIDVVLRVSDAASGMPVDGLALAVVPWMPAHGHGTSVPTAVAAEGDGYYLVKPVDLYMSGRWELRTAIDDVSGTHDDVVPVVDIP